MASISHKRGDTLEWVVTLTQDGSAVDISGWTISSDVRNGDTLIQSLTVAITDGANGVFSLSATPTETASWTLGTHSVDIELIDDSDFVVSSSTFTLTLVKDITYD